MVAVEKDEVPMLPSTDRHSDRHGVSPRRRISYRTRSVSISIPVSSNGSTSGSTSFSGCTGPLRSGRMTPDMQMTSSPSNVNQWQGNPSRSMHGAVGSERKDPAEQAHIRIHDHHWRDSHYELYSFRYGDAKGWAATKLSLLKRYTFGVMNPHAQVIQQWNQFFVISCLLAIFIDPLFFHLLSVKKDQKCIVINWPMMKTIVIFRSITDLIFLLNMILQLRLAFVSPESRVMGANELVDHPKKVALLHRFGFFFLDLFILLPLPQIIVLFILPISGANYARYLLQLAIFIQYIPRSYRFQAFVAGQSPSGFIFESSWANGVFTLLAFALCGHVVGSCWYLFGLQRVSQCFRDACQKSGIIGCMRFIDCGHANDFRSFEVGHTWYNWIQNEDSSACFKEDFFDYGIYVKAVNLTTENNIFIRYIYSLFWGFQQISTLTGNQTPSYFVWEILFTLAIIGLGLLFFAFAFGNMQSFYQGLGRRRLEMSLRRRDVEQWMSRRHLPEELRRKVRQSEHWNWVATQGVNEEMIMENLSDDLQRDIRRHLFVFVKKVPILGLLDDLMLDAICERLRQKTYAIGSRVLYQGGLVTKMVFIVQGKMESMGEDETKVTLSEGDVCGEELLTWCLEHSFVDGDTRNHVKPGYILLCNRMVKCLTNVEAFVLHSADLEEVASLFSGYLRNHRIQTAIRNKSPYWRSLAATCIQVAWRSYRKSG